MIDVQEEDRDALCFAWSNEGGRPTTYRLTSVPFGTCASLFILYAVLQAHYDRYSSDFGDKVLVVRGRQYVDDTMLTFFGKFTDDLNTFCQRFTELMAKANMKMSKWHSSNLELATIADPLLDCGCKVFHNYGYMVSVFRRLVVYIMNLARKCGSTHFDNVHKDQVALQMMTRFCQLSHFAEDIDSLKRHKRIPRVC